MVFSSSIFLVFFLPVFLLLYIVLPYKIKNAFALAASVGFYAWGAPVFVFVVLGSIVVDFFLVAQMANKEGRIRQLLLALSVCLNAGLLLYFKYANFFVENVNDLLEFWNFKAISWIHIALPIGISFFTFQKLTYSVDVYRKVYRPLKNISDYALYILMFPQLIAGPIVRYHEIADQLVDRRDNENNNNRLTGFFRFGIGLAKKVLIANVMGEQADLIFATDPLDLSAMAAWTGVVAYAFQIYFDFSGYSDMAIGLGRMMGFDFPENFNNPYISGSITEFWRRWHITLGRWMKDYLYIPLGGSRVSVRRMYLNLWIVFLISGLWHGAAWNFVFWGAFHGFFLVAERLFLFRIYKKLGKVVPVIWIFFLTLIGWVFFRADNMDHAFSFISAMFGFAQTVTASFVGTKFITILCLAAIFSFAAIFPQVEAWQQQLYEKGKNTGSLIAMGIAAIALYIMSLAYVSSSGFNPFIYFRF